MLSTILLFAAVLCWAVGAFNPATLKISWTNAGLAFAGAGLWLAPLL